MSVGFLNNISQHFLSAYYELDTVLSTFTFSLIKYVFSIHHAPNAGNCGYSSEHNQQSPTFMELIFGADKQMSKKAYIMADSDECYGEKR